MSMGYVEVQILKSDLALIGRVAEPGSECPWAQMVTATSPDLEVSDGNDAAL
jgi:hypothetical protein